MLIRSARWHLTIHSPSNICYAIEAHKSIMCCSYRISRTSVANFSGTCWQLGSKGITYYWCISSGNPNNVCRRVAMPSLHIPHLMLSSDGISSRHAVQSLYVKRADTGCVFFACRLGRWCLWHTELSQFLFRTGILQRQCRRSSRMSMSGWCHSCSPFVDVMDLMFVCVI